jgi:two-component system, sensor histidine kinase PdtaS
MDERVMQIPNLTERDRALLHKIESNLSITADVSRADVMLCCQWGREQIIVARHAPPRSISSIYLGDATGRLFSATEQPGVYRALIENQSGSRRKQIPSSGAPVIQHIYPIQNAANRVIAAMLVEINMIEYQRHRRRDKPFRQAVRWLQEMAIHGEIEISEPIKGFGSLDGIYLVDENMCIEYLSGIATNLYRSIGLVQDMRGRHVSELEELDEKLVDQAMQANRCIEFRHESNDGRVWVRTVIPLRARPGSWQRIQRTVRSRLLWKRLALKRAPQVDGALVLVHNATEQVQKERELNVKSAMIQEVHHRVKNNLQTIAAILRIQARRCQSEEAQQHLTDAVNRILSMSVIHEFLSQDEHRPISIRDVCLRIIGQAQQVAVNPGQEIEISVSGPNIRLPAGQATAAALVINELILNAIEHGLQGREQGKITMLLEDLGDLVRIAIEDNGAGMPYGFNLSENRSLGLQITRTLVTDDLKGQLDFSPLQNPPEQENSEPDDSGHLHATGTRATVTFPKRSMNLAEVEPAQDILKR